MKRCLVSCLSAGRLSVSLQAIFRIEQDFEIASADYEQHNSALKNELPQFFALATAFITPLFESFYYMQCQSNYEIRLYSLISGYGNDSASHLCHA